MPRRKDTNEWKTDSRGRYRRMVGWKDEGGKRIQQPFYFGTDLDQAKARYLRVRELWTHLELMHQESPEPQLNSKFELPDPSECRLGFWVALGRPRASCGACADRCAPSEVELMERLRLDDRRTRQAVSDGYFVPEEPETYKAGEGHLAVVRQG